MKRLEVVKAVDKKPADQSRIFFGAWVELEDLDAGGIEVYRLVGADEIDPAQHKISIDSPLGRQLLGKRLDDEISLAIMGTTAQWLISEICYTPRVGNRENPAVD